MIQDLLRRIPRTGRASALLRDGDCFGGKRSGDITDKLALLVTKFYPISRGVGESCLFVAQDDLYHDGVLADCMDDS